MRFMNSSTACRMAGLLVGAALAAVLAVPASAQNPKLDLDGIKSFATPPAESVKVDVDERLMRLVVGLLDESEAEAKAILTSLQGVYVRHFKFEAPGQYRTDEVDAIRSQLTRGGWVRLVEARSAREGNDADAFLAMQGDRIIGFAIVVSNPTEVTIVNIVGTIDPAQLRKLGGQLGIPKIEIGDPAPKRGGAGGRP